MYTIVTKKDDNNFVSKSDFNISNEINKNRYDETVNENKSIKIESTDNLWFTIAFTGGAIISICLAYLLFLAWNAKIKN